jgi:hypothetical protein
MRPKRHPSARTTPSQRRAIQLQSDASLRKIAEEHGVNVKTVAKWRKRNDTADEPMGPKNPVSTAFALPEEGAIVLYRKYTRLTLDETLLRLRAIIPHLSRSSLQRCLRRYGVNKIPHEKRQKLVKLPVEKDSGNLFFEIHVLPDESFLFFAISNLTKWVFARVVPKPDAYAAVVFLKEIVEEAPFTIRTVETNNFEAFTADGKPWDLKYPNRRHPFPKACELYKVFPMLVKANDPSPKKIAKGWDKEQKLSKRKKRLPPDVVLTAEEHAELFGQNSALPDVDDDEPLFKFPGSISLKKL